MNEKDKIISDLMGDQEKETRDLSGFRMPEKSVVRLLILMVLPVIGLFFLLDYGDLRRLTETRRTAELAEIEETAESSSVTEDVYTSTYRLFVPEAADGDDIFVEIPLRQSAEEWMKGRTIPAQVLYEDEDYRLEVTDYEFTSYGGMTLHTLFTNNTKNEVSAHTPDSVFANDTLRTPYIIYSTSFGRNVYSQSRDKINLSPYEIFWFDPYLEKLEFSLEVYDPEDSKKPAYLVTDPIVLYTEPAVSQDETAGEEENIDGENTLGEANSGDGTSSMGGTNTVSVENSGGGENSVSGENSGFEIVTYPSMKTLYESDEIRVIRTGIYEYLEYKNGIPEEDNERNPRWEFLVENRTGHDVIIDHRSCEVNGQKALSHLKDEDYVEVDDPEEGLIDEDYYVEENRLPKVIPAGMRRTFNCSLNRPAVSSDGNSSEKTEPWPLEEITSGSAAFTMHYTDGNGEAQSVRIEDAFTLG